jgi:hypothetical protein
METPAVVVLTPNQVRDLVDRALREGADRALEGVRRDLQAVLESTRAMRGVLSESQLCELFKISDQTLRAYRRRGLRSYKVGREPVFLTEDVIEFIRQYPEDSQAD